MNLTIDGHLLWCSCISNSFVNEALARCDYGALVPQPGQCNWDLLFVAAAHAIGDDIDLVPSSKKIDCGLCDTNMAFNADDDGGDGSIRAERIESFLNVWCTAKSQC